MKHLLWIFVLMLLPSVWAQHQVTVTSTGTDCNTGTACGLSDCTCNLQVYRARCSDTTSCPAVTMGSPYVQLVNNNLTANVGATQTAWSFIDQDVALVDNSVWIYFETASYVRASPAPVSAPSAPTAPTTIPKATIAHQASLNWSSNSCTTATPCAIQVYRAQCSSSTSCPTYPGSAFSQLSGYGITVNAGANGTSWIITDNDPALLDATTYVWVATNSYQSSPSNPGPASTPWSGTTSAPPPAVPVAPTSGPGNSVTKNRGKDDKKKVAHDAH